MSFPKIIRNMENGNALFYVFYNKVLGYIFNFQGNVL